MIDVRVESFLAVWKHKSYTRAAEELCITQPAVTQHIQFLEKEYGCKLLTYASKELRLTKAGEIFYRYAKNMKVNQKQIVQQIKEIDGERKALNFGATLTIGEFTLAPILGKFIKAFDGYSIRMHVDNTKRVLKMLEEGEISFALVEGLLNKAHYTTRLYKKADFILVGSKKHHLTMKKTVCLEDLEMETIVVREKGSGSREVLERGLFDQNYTLENFQRIIEIGNVNVIKAVVKDGIGLSFMYQDAVREELEKGELVQIPLTDFVIQREFNFVYLKDQMEQAEIHGFFSFLKDHV